MSDKIPDIVSSLENHPHIRQVTPHKKVTRTLKLVKCENLTNAVHEIGSLLLFLVEHSHLKLIVRPHRSTTYVDVAYCY